MENLQKDSQLNFIRFTVRGDNPKAIYSCSCGTKKELFYHNVRRGLTKSCGCLRIRCTKIRCYTHGLSKHPLYPIRRAIIDRCYNVRNGQYKDYGGRGVTVCNEWVNSFILFYNWCINNGWKKGLEIDKDIKGGMIYSPDNCMIVTGKQNMNKIRRNRIIELDGISKTLQEWCDEKGVSRKLIGDRINRYGWSAKEAFDTPKQIHK